MEIELLISALEETVTLMRKSQSSEWANMPVPEIIEKLETEITNARNSQTFDSNLLGSLFAPTGAIQETSIANGWENEFLRIAEIVDRFTALHF